MSLVVFFLLMILTPELIALYIFVLYIKSITKTHTTKELHEQNKKRLKKYRP